MSKVTLSNVGSLVSATTAQTAINDNFSAIADAIEVTLSRDGTSPNTMSDTLDMNSQHIINLPQPAGATEPLRYQDLSSFVGGGTVTNIPAGGATKDVLSKNTGTNYDIGWKHISDLVLPGSNISVSGTSPLTVNVLTSPTFVAPSLGTATVTSINKVAITAPATSATLTIADGKTFTCNQSITLAGTAGTYTTPTGTSTLASLEGNETFTGVKTFNSGKLQYAGATSGLTILNASATASGTLTLPAATDTLVGKATTDTFTNKTWDTNGTGNSFAIAGFAVNATTGTGTTLVRSTSPTITTPALTGRTDAGSASAGNVGEQIISTIASGSAVALTNNTGANVTSISLTAGDWEVDGIVQFTGATTTTVTLCASTITTASATVGFANGQGCAVFLNGATPFNNTVNNVSAPIPPFRVNINSTTTYFLVAYATFATSTCSAYGQIRARRVQS